jgi:nitrogenase molybdenum-iron protein alpha chain
MSRHDSLPVQAVKLGIPTFFASDANVMGGYDGVIFTGKRLLEAIRSRNFVKNLAAHNISPYTNWWNTCNDALTFTRSEGF